jgi:glycosyltransferase involved in cell wall biosynthesis
MASGCAVIAGSKVGAARDLIHDGVNGWVFESGNLAALSRVLRKALAVGHEGLRRLGEAGRRVSENWSTERAAEKIAQAASYYAVADNSSHICG